MKTSVPREITSKYLQKELEAAERRMARTRDKQEAYDAPSLPTDESGGLPKPPATQKLPKRVQLQIMQTDVETLAFTQQFAEWIREAPSATLEGEDSADPGLVVAEAEWCCRLAALFLEHPSISRQEIGFEIFENTYTPLLHYVSASLESMIQFELDANGYYSVDGTATALIQQCESSPETCAFGQACRCLMQVDKCSVDVADFFEIAVAPVGATQTIVRALLRPFVQRVQFHFVEASPERPTTTKIDRLPEWLLTFIKENVLESNDETPRALIQDGIACCLSIEDTDELFFFFLSEINRLVRTTLHKRNFFEHSDISGPGSNPLLLYNAIEQFLTYDQNLRQSYSKSVRPIRPVGGLMDSIVMADDQLSQWWIERERESVFTTLFEDDLDVTKPLANHVSPRAEIFCALIRSVQWKASCLSEPGPYLRNVAVPLCTQFVDAIHSTSTDLRNLLSNPPLQGGDIDRQHLSANLSEWIEIINGANLASTVLLQPETESRESQSSHDLARFGQSLERLAEVMAEEFASVFVETLLMEKAKLASYLMMASHLLSSQEWHDTVDLSEELKTAYHILKQFNQLCDSITGFDIDPTAKRIPGSSSEVAHFAPSRMQDLVNGKVSTKVLDVVLDVDGTTPDLWQNGARIFARDVTLLSSGYTLAPPTQRLLDIIGLLTMESASNLFEALSQLSQTSGPLDVQHFTADLTLFEQAVFMLKAKGLPDIRLEDAVSILNRRRD